MKEKMQTPLWSRIEIYTPERKAQFLLSNAIGFEDYQVAVEDVRKLGLRPEEIPHLNPLETS